MKNYLKAVWRYLSDLNIVVKLLALGVFSGLLAFVMLLQMSSSMKNNTCYQYRDLPTEQIPAKCIQYFHNVYLPNGTQ